jgi:hypothetical protein
MMKISRIKFIGLYGFERYKYLYVRYGKNIVLFMNLLFEIFF